MSDKKKTAGAQGEAHYSLNDDRRVKVLSPGALVAKRFFRNRLAIVGLSILIFMFVFSFLGGLVSPYRQDEIFYKQDMTEREYAGVIENTEYRYLKATDDFGALVQAKTVQAINSGAETFKSGDVEYTLTQEGEGLYSIYMGRTLIGAAYLDVISSTVESGVTFPFDFQYNALKTYVKGGGDFRVNGVSYHVDGEGSITQNGADYATVGRYVVQGKASGVVITNEFREAVSAALEADAAEFEFTDGQGATAQYAVEYSADTKIWTIFRLESTTLIDRYSFPTREHWLGTDSNGMDMLTRLMYGGRVSLIIGFIVVFIETFIGVIFGGIAGYFGGWVDNLIMRIVDIFYCIPSTPIIIILGAAMDAMRVDPQIRMLYLMLILGILGWAGIARLVRGQILSLREQEFMTATEACGINVSRRIFRHLVPNVIPQLIVNCTMSLGSVIITESTLSFLGLGVKFPFASWGNIINDVSNSYTLTTYLFVWIPAGICLMLTVLGFNFVGDGLRDAFDPKMKR